MNEAPKRSVGRPPKAHIPELDVVQAPVPKPASRRVLKLELVEGATFTTTTTGIADVGDGFLMVSGGKVKGDMKLLQGGNIHVRIFAADGRERLFGVGMANVKSYELDPAEW